MPSVNSEVTKKTLLIVDDEEMLLHVLEAYFDSDYTVLIAHCGSEALQLARNRSIDVTILDVCMPDMDGIEVLRHLKCLRPNIEVIMFTGLPLSDVTEDASRLGAREVLNKGPHLRGLRAAVERAMQSSSCEMAKQPESALAQQSLPVALKPMDAPRTKDLAFSGSSLGNPERPRSEKASFDELAGEVLTNTVAAFVHKLNNELVNLTQTAREIGQQINELTDERGTQLKATQARLSEVIESTSYLLQRFRNTIGRHPGVLRPTNVAHILTDVAKHLGVRFSNRLVLQMPSSHFEVSGDYELLWHLFENLIRNGLEAVQAQPDGLVTVSGWVDSSHHVVSIVIKDNGSGIAPSVIPRIFELNYSTKSRGLGVGVYLARRAAHIHGGQIECQSDVGKGATFIVTLPQLPPKQN